MHERYNPKMKWETARMKESKSSTHGKLDELSGGGCPRGNQERDTEVNGMNLKSQTSLLSAEMDKLVTR
jgi:hypothetical protein